MCFWKKLARGFGIRALNLEFEPSQARARLKILWAEPGSCPALVNSNGWDQMGQSITGVGTCWAGVALDGHNGERS